MLSALQLIMEINAMVRNIFPASGNAGIRITNLQDQLQLICTSNNENWNENIFIPYYA